MKLATTPIGGELSWLPVDIIEVSNTLSGLRIVAEGSRGTDRFAEVHFAGARAFQALDEGDLMGYCDPPLRSKYLVYRIDAGGWRERVGDHFLHCTDAKMPEWLIVTECLCVNVLSGCTPHIREF